MSQTQAVTSRRGGPEPTLFEREAAATLGRLQAALAELVRSVGGSGARRAADLQRVFRVDPKLAWQIHRAVNASTPFESGAALPAAAGVRRFLRAAAKRNGPADLLTTTEAAVQEFDDLVARHAGDREVFDSMVAGLAGPVGDQVDLAHKKALFRGQAHLLGISAATQFACSAFHPAGEGKFDTLVLRGLKDLRRRRPDVPFPLSRVVIRPTKEPPAGDTPWREPLEPDAEARIGAPVLPRFTSQPMPHFQTRTLDPMHTLVELAGDEVGQTAAVSYTLGDVFRNAEYPGLLSEGGGYTDRKGGPVPSENLLSDFLIHESLVHGEPRVGVWTDVSGAGQTGPLAQWRQTALRLPVRQSIDYLGLAPDVLPSPLVPHYPEAVVWACERLGWNVGSFHVFRSRVEYPIAHSVLLTEFDLPGPA